MSPGGSPGRGCARAPGAGRALASVGVPAAPPAGAGEIPGKGQNPARQKQKLSPVTHNWWNICSNFFFFFPLRLGSSTTCQEAAVPVRLARLVEGCAAAAGTGSVRWGRAGADVVGHGLWDSLPSPKSRRAVPHLPCEGPSLKDHKIAPLLGTPLAQHAASVCLCG